MAKPRRQLDALIEALVRERLEGGEIIEGWSEYRPGEIVVRLISAESHDVCAPSVKKFRRGTGCGRTLLFKRQDGQWTFVSVGGWMS